MRKLFGIILMPITLVTFCLLLVIFQPIQWAAYRFSGYAAHKKVVDFLNLCLLRTYIFMGDPVVFINKQNLPIGSPMIFVANHQSLIDIPPLIYFLRKYHAKFISKIELTRNIPSISFNLKYGGAANIDRKDPRQSITEIMKLGTRMKENKWSAVIFPEGTRQQDGKMQHFQAAGVATLLKKCPEALIVPIAINNSWKVNFPPSAFVKMTWEVLEPIDPKGRSAEDVVKEAEDRIRNKLKS
jgi:1-acyl-sn-glycerol-3-phosphate acyltransferase